MSYLISQMCKKDAGGMWAIMPASIVVVEIFHTCGQTSARYCHTITPFVHLSLIPMQMLGLQTRTPIDLWWSVKITLLAWGSSHLINLSLSTASEEIRAAISAGSEMCTQNLLRLAHVHQQESHRWQHISSLTLLIGHSGSEFPLCVRCLWH